MDFSLPVVIHHDHNLLRIDCSGQNEWRAVAADGKNRVELGLDGVQADVRQQGPLRLSSMSGAQRCWSPPASDNPPTNTRTRPPRIPPIPTCSQSSPSTRNRGENMAAKPDHFRRQRDPSRNVGIRSLDSSPLKCRFSRPLYHSHVNPPPRGQMPAAGRRERVIVCRPTCRPRSGHPFVARGEPRFAAQPRVNSKKVRSGEPKTMSQAGTTEPETGR